VWAKRVSAAQPSLCASAPLRELSVAMWGQWQCGDRIAMSEPSGFVSAVINQLSPGVHTTLDSRRRPPVSQRDRRAEHARSQRGPGRPAPPLPRPTSGSQVGRGVPAEPTRLHPPLQPSTLTLHPTSTRILVTRAGLAAHCASASPASASGTVWVTSASVGKPPRCRRAMTA